MATNKMHLQGVAIIVVGIFFLILTSLLYALNYVKSDRLLIFDGLSILLVAMGFVVIALSRRVPEQQVKKPRQKS